VNDRVEDAAGRSGPSIWWVDQQLRHDTIFSAADGTLLGERTTAVEMSDELDLPVGAISQLTAIHVAAVDTLGNVPSAAAFG
jgi:hypothetical protein